MYAYDVISMILSEDVRQTLDRSPSTPRPHLAASPPTTRTLGGSMQFAISDCKMQYAMRVARTPTDTPRGTVSV